MKNKSLITLLLTVIATTSVAAPTPLPVSPIANDPDCYCPNINEAKKEPVKGNWIAETNIGKWKSYDMSFATDLVQFIGAQWVGEVVGQMTCIYQSEQRFTMNDQAVSQPTIPVLLVFHALTYQPTDGQWKNVKAGLYNCHSQQRSDCPFKMQLVPKTGNIIDEAESLKDSASPPLQAPSY